MDEQLKNKIKKFICEYTDIDKDLKRLKDELKTKTKQKNELTSQLVVFMKDINVDCFEVGNSAIVHKKRKTRQCLSRKYLKSVLSDQLGDDEYVNSLLDIIMEQRNVKEVDLLVCKNI